MRRPLLLLLLPLLFLILILATTAAAQGFELPRVAPVGAVPGDLEPMVLRVDAEGRIEFEGSGEAPGALRPMLSSREGRPILLRLDRRVPWGVAEWLLANCAEYGITRVFFAVTPSGDGEEGVLALPLVAGTPEPDPRKRPPPDARLRILTRHRRGALAQLQRVLARVGESQRKGMRVRIGISPGISVEDALRTIAVLRRAGIRRLEIMVWIRPIPGRPTAGGAWKLFLRDRLPPGGVDVELDYRPLRVPPETTPVELEPGTTGAAVQLLVYDPRTEQLRDRSRFLLSPHRTDHAIDRALSWLARNQRGDGSWDGDVAATAIATLGMINAGHPGRGGDPLDGVCRRALDYLAGRQDENGIIRSSSGKRSVFQHCLATFALNEGYQRARWPRDEPVLRKAARILESCRGEDRAWPADTPGGKADWTTTAWAWLTLGSLQRTGFIDDERFAELAHDLRRWSEMSFDTPFAPTGVIDLGLGGELYRNVETAAPEWETGSADLDHTFFLVIIAGRTDPAKRRVWANRSRQFLMDRQRKGDGVDRGSWDPVQRGARTWPRAFTTGLALLDLAELDKFE